LACFAFVVIKQRSLGIVKEHFPLVDLFQIRKTATLRENCIEVESNHFVFDPTLGVRLKPNSRVISLESNPDGTPRIATSKWLHVDQYGFISNHSDAAHDVDYARLANDPRVYRIVVSGGSTVAGWGASGNETTWPAVLESVLNARIGDIQKKYCRVAVFNGAVLDYNIALEIKRFQEETVYLNPHLVVCFDGINEPWKYFNNPVGYAVKGPQRRMMQILNYGPPRKTWLVFPYFSLAVAEMTAKKREGPQYGYENPGYVKLHETDLYLSKVQQFKALCDGAGIDFLHVLQPIMGTGDHVLTEEEEKLKRFFNTSMYSISWEDYHASCLVFYAKVAARLIEPWQVDMSGLFDGEARTVYADPRHYNDLGQGIIAQAIAERILEKGFLTQGRDFPVATDVLPKYGARNSTLTRRWSFWYDQLSVSTIGRDGLPWFINCTRPLAASPGTAWRCTCTANSSLGAVAVTLDESLDANVVGEQLARVFAGAETTPDDFARSERVLLRIDKDYDLSQLNANSDAALSTTPEGIRLAVQRKNPYLTLPDFSWQSDETPVFCMEITAPVETIMELFYKSPTEEKYTIEQRFVRQILPGRNTLYIALQGVKPGVTFWLHPAAEQGDFILYRIEVRAVSAR
jgi:hypothetical protein